MYYKNYYYGGFVECNSNTEMLLINKSLIDIPMIHPTWLVYNNLLSLSRVMRATIQVNLSNPTSSKLILTLSHIKAGQAFAVKHQFRTALN